MILRDDSSMFPVARLISIIPVVHFFSEASEQNSRFKGSSDTLTSQSYFVLPFAFLPANFFHYLCQTLILPRAVFINKILIEPLTANPEHTAIKGDSPFDSACLCLNFIMKSLKKSELVKLMECSKGTILE